MAVSGGWLIDKSAYARLPLSPDADEWFVRMERGQVAVTSVTLLELGYSARSSADWSTIVRRPPLSRLPVRVLTPAIEARALEVQGLLAERGQHRAASIPDLLIAAAAERYTQTVLHVDKDFELVATVTGQLVERLSGDF